MLMQKKKELGFTHLTYQPLIQKNWCLQQFMKGKMKQQLLQN